MSTFNSKKLPSILLKDAVFLSLTYTLAFFLILFHNGLYIDDWYEQLQGKAGYIYHNVICGRPWFGYLQLPLFPYDDVFKGTAIYLFRVVIFISFLVPCLLFNSFLKRISAISTGSRLFLSLLFTTMPLFHSRIFTVMWPYGFAHFAFYAGFYLALYKNRPLLRLLSLTLFFLSFLIQSYLTLYFVLFFYFIYEKRSSLDASGAVIPWLRSVFWLALKVVRKNLDYFILPFLTWLAQRLLYQPHGDYVDYNNISLGKILKSPLWIVESLYQALWDLLTYVPTFATRAGFWSVPFLIFLTTVFYFFLTKEKPLPPSIVPKERKAHLWIVLSTICGAILYRGADAIEQKISSLTAAAFSFSGVTISFAYCVRLFLLMLPALVLTLASATLFIRQLKSTKKADTSFSGFFILFSLVSFFLALFPYGAVEKALPQIYSWANRNLLLGFLPLAFFIYYASHSFVSVLERLFPRKKIRHYLPHVFAVYAALFVNYSLYSWVDYHIDWYKQLSVIENMKRSQKVARGQFFLMNDRVGHLNALKRHPLIWYEYIGWLRGAYPEAFKNQKFKFADDERNFITMQKGRSDLNPFYLLGSNSYPQADFYLVGYVPQRPFYRLTLTSGPLQITGLIDVLHLKWQQLNTMNQFQNTIKDFIDLKVEEIDGRAWSL